MLEGRCTRGEIGKDFIILKPHFTPGEVLEFEIQNFIKSHLSMHEFPREIEFINALLGTPDGKVQRKELKKREYEIKGVSDLFPRKLVQVMGESLRPK